MAEQNDFQLIAQESNLPVEKLKSLQSAFEGFFKDARELVEGANDLVVTDLSQIDLIKQAREKRLKLRAIRVEVEHTRVDLKAQIVREGKAIDGFANILKALIVPVEEHLEKQEKFAELAQAKMLAERLVQRTEALMPYVTDMSVYNLKEMSDNSFNDLLRTSKEAFEIRKEQERQAAELEAEKDRKFRLHLARKEQLIPYWIFLSETTVTLHFGEMSQESFDELLNEAKQAQKADADARMKEKAETERLQKEAQEKERLAEIEKKKQEVALAKEREEKQKQIDEANRIAREAEEKLKAEKEAQLEKTRLENEAVEARKRADDEARRLALLAPDKEKLIEIAKQITLIKLPAVESKEAKEILDKVMGKLFEATDILNEGAKKL